MHVPGILIAFKLCHCMMSQTKTMVDGVAVSLMPSDAGEGVVPLQVLEDGNCLFHTTSKAVHRCRLNSKSLHQDCC